MIVIEKGDYPSGVALIDCYAIILTTLAARWVPAGPAGLLENALCSEIPRLESTGHVSFSKQSSVASAGFRVPGRKLI